MGGDEPYAYYGTSRSRSPHWRNEVTRGSLHSLMTFDALGAADLLAGTPLLVVHGERDAYCSPALAQALYDRTRGDKEILWLDAGLHTDLYDNPPYVNQAVRRGRRLLPSEVSRLRRIDVVVRRPQAKPLSQVDGGPLGVVSRRASGGHRLVRSGSLGGGSRLRPDLGKRHRGRRGGRRRCQSRQGSLRVRRRAARLVGGGQLALVGGGVGLVQEEVAPLLLNAGDFVVYASRLRSYLG